MNLNEKLEAIGRAAEAQAKEAARPNPRAGDKTSLAYWFPLIEAAGLPVPRTDIIRESMKDNAAMRECIIDGTSGGAESLLRLSAKIRCAAAGIVGAANPFFLRTSHTSHKHDWKDTCYVSDWNLIHHHIAAMVEFSEMADFMGLPTDVWVVREMLQTRPLFHAFGGRMPITREFRYFVRDGAVEHRQPYWPADSIIRPDVPNWRDLLAAASQDPPPELEVLTIKANLAVPGYWSVDWLETVDRGWVLTDMAEGGKSYKYDPAAHGDPDRSVCRDG